jgi:hypothetical protein
MERLVRGGWDELESAVVVYGEPAIAPETRASVRCHFLRSDPNGVPRLAALARQLADQVIHYCIPRSELLKAQAEAPDRSAAAVTRLARQAARLFTQTQVKTGEGAEMLLYALLEKELGVPQVLSKMTLKTSTEMQIHGADGVHAKLLDNGDLALYWGEAKMYESIAGAMSDCMSSLEPYLTGQANEQDVFLLRHYADTGNAALTERLLQYFDDGSILSANVEMRGACLIGFSHSDYPQLPRDLVNVQEQIDEALGGWVSSVATRVQNRSMHTYEIEVFLVPVPSVQDFRDAVKRELGIPVTL